MDDDLNAARTRAARGDASRQRDGADLTAAWTKRAGRPTRPRLVLRRRTAGVRLEFDPLAAYLGLLVGIAVGLGSPTAAPILKDAAMNLCVVGAIEVGRDGATECLP